MENKGAEVVLLLLTGFCPLKGQLPSVCLRKVGDRGCEQHDANTAATNQLRNASCSARASYLSQERVRLYLILLLIHPGWI